MKLVRINRDRRERYRLQAQNRYTQRAIDRAENDLSHLKEDEERERGFIKGRIKYLKQKSSSIGERVELLNDRNTKLDPDLLENDALSGMFKMFLASAAAFSMYFWIFYESVVPQLSSSLFDSDPYLGFQSVIYLLLPIIVFFMLIQSLVPSTIALLNPKGLLARLQEDSSNDPLGQSTYFLFFLGAALSFLMTYGAFAVGHFLVPASYVPQTLQMVLSNAVFDGLTFAITLFLMKMVERFEGWKAFAVVLVLIAADIVIAAIFAMLSLYMGLLGGDHAISIQECINILFALDLAGEKQEFGPLFWVMHTAFLPTLLYLLLVLFFTLTKLIISLIAITTKHASNRGLMATGGMLTALAGIVQIVVSNIPESIAGSFL